MKGTGAILEGQLDPWPPPRELARVLEAGGLRVEVGEYAVDLPDFAHFRFEHYGSDVREPVASAGAKDVDALLRDATRVSAVLAAAGIAHAFEIYADEGDEDMAAYVHHDWPCVRQSPADPDDP